MAYLKFKDTKLNLSEIEDTSADVTTDMEIYQPSWAFTRFMDSIGSAGDKDWHKVTLEAGSSYQVDLNGVDANGQNLNELVAKSLTLVDPIISGIFDNEGTAIEGLYNDDASPYTYDSQLIFVASQNGTHFINDHDLMLPEGPTEALLPHWSTGGLGKYRTDK